MTWVCVLDIRNLHGKKRWEERGLWGGLVFFSLCLLIFAGLDLAKFYLSLRMKRGAGIG